MSHLVVQSGIMLVDKARITVRAGDGGDGAATLRRDGQTARGGPDGGDGGNGGSVLIQGDHNLNDLSEFQHKKKITAPNGEPGGRRNLYGKRGEDVTIFVPLGTQILSDAGEEIGEIINETASILIARGGRGGRGNMKFKSSTRRTPRIAEKGTAGEERVITLNLRLIAEIGLVGLPNAGKSSLLAALTHATPRIGSFPFTTLSASIGMMDGHAIADIPGLIEGAAHGRGLGTRFLKHIEKTQTLVHVIDASVPDPMKAYETVRSEFRQYGSDLLSKKEVILLNKIDLVDPDDLQNIITLFEKKGFSVLTSSVYRPDTITGLKKSLAQLVL